MMVQHFRTREYQQLETVLTYHQLLQQPQPIDELLTDFLHTHSYLETHHFTSIFQESTQVNKGVSG